LHALDYQAYQYLQILQIEEDSAAKAVVVRAIEVANAATGGATSFANVVQK
jgi:hypothetical protein